MKKRNLKNKKVIKKVENKYNVKFSKFFVKEKNECNQCHGNCNDCGWDR